MLLYGNTLTERLTTITRLSGHLKQHSEQFKEYEQQKNENPSSSSMNVTSNQSVSNFTQKLLDRPKYWSKHKLMPGQYD